MVRHWNIRFFGWVQGVFFRQFIKDTAKMLGVKGFVRNEPDGTVYTEAEEEEKVLEEFLNLCKKGNHSVKVERVEIEKGEIENFEDFIIKY